MWDKIWGEEPPIVDIADAKYKFTLTQIAEQIALTIYDAEDKVMSAETLNLIFTVMEPGLSFRDLY